MDVSSELMAVTPFGADIVEMHLVSFTENEQERYGLWVELPNGGGAMFATFADDMDFGTAMSFFISMTWAEVTGGSDRAQQLMESSKQRSGLIVPDDSNVVPLNP